MTDKSVPSRNFSETSARGASEKQRSRRLAVSLQQLRWMIGIRMVVITSAVLPYFLLQLASPNKALGIDVLYLLAAATYSASLVYLVLLRLLHDRAEIQFWVQFSGDLLLITGLVYAFGGIGSPFSILYLIVITIASVVMPRKAGFSVATIAWFLYATVGLAVQFDWLPSAREVHESTPSLAAHELGLSAAQPAQKLPQGRLAYALFTHLVGFYAVAYLISYLARNLSLTEQELEEKREHLADLRVLHRDIVESVPSGLITCDSAGIVTLTNTAAQTILSKNDDALIGRPLARSGLFSEEQWKALMHGEMGDSSARPQVVYERDGKSRHIGYSLNILTDAGGERSGYVLIFQDLSNWKKMQDEMRLSERMAAVGEMASGIAHEVGNPLASITGSVQMLAGSLQGTESQMKLLDIILKEGQRLDRNIKSFLRFARPKERSSVRFDIAGLLMENLELLRNSPEVLDTHRLELDLEPQSVTLVADPDQMSQIFWNLARNALRAMPEGGTLTIEGRQSEDRYRIRFIDTGRGMTDFERKRAFHPFRSFFDSGTGIGMAIVFRIVEEHGGKLTIDSNIGKGTTILVDLPMQFPAVTAAAEEVEV